MKLDACFCFCEVRTSEKAKPSFPISHQDVLVKGTESICSSPDVSFSLQELLPFLVKQQFACRVVVGRDNKVLLVESHCPFEVRVVASVKVATVELEAFAVRELCVGLTSDCNGWLKIQGIFSFLEFGSSIFSPLKIVLKVSENGLVLPFIEIVELLQ